MAMLVLGCDGSEPETDAGPEPVECDEVLTECPMGRDPYPGAACEGDFTCSTGLGGVPSDVQCIDGEIFWLCAGCTPPLSERCDDPASLSSGQTLEIGPSDSGAFAPWSNGDRVRAIVGPQGAAMLQFRVRVAGEAPPSCVSLDIRADLEGMMGDTTTQTVLLRCGESQGVFAILPGLPCELRDWPAHLSVTAPGADPLELDLVIEGEECAAPG